MTEPTPPHDLSYSAAIDELEAILAEIEDDALDLDHLTERVTRAAGLIRMCRERILRTRLEVERVVTDLDRPESAAHDQEGASPPPS